MTQPTGHRYCLQAGDLRNLHQETFTLEPPAAGQVSIAVRAIGLNFADIFAIWGLYGATPKGSFTPGLEFAGDVIAVGEGVTDLRVGDRIMGVTRFGAYTTHLNMDARYVIPLPDGWDYATGSAYLVQTLTAYYAMRNLGNMQPGMTILIHSAAGGVGQQAIKIAKAFQCNTIGTIGDASKEGFLRSLGCDDIIVRQPGAFEQQLKQALGDRPLELVLDSIGGEYFKAPLKLLAPMGRIIVFGSARYASPGDRPNKLRMFLTWLQRPKIDPQRMVEKNQGVLGFNLIWLFHRVNLLHDLLRELDGLHLAPPHVGHRLPFDQLRDAVALFQTGKTVGKVVVEV